MGVPAVRAAEAALLIPASLAVCVPDANAHPKCLTRQLLSHPAAHAAGSPPSNPDDPSKRTIPAGWNNTSSELNRTAGGSLCGIDAILCCIRS